MTKKSNAHHEKGALSSKKFKAFLFTETGFFILMGMMVTEQEMGALGENMSFMTLAVTAGFLGIGIILGQSYVDKYTRVAAIMAGHGTSKEEEEEKK
jgi:TRAP-type C4-dicarboxylate transport system permease small subunit